MEEKEAARETAGVTTGVESGVAAGLTRPTGWVMTILKRFSSLSHLAVTLWVLEWLGPGHSLRALVTLTETGP